MITTRVRYCYEWMGVEKKKERKFLSLPPPSSSSSSPVNKLYNLYHYNYMGAGVTYILTRSDTNNINTLYFYYTNTITTTAATLL